VAEVHYVLRPRAFSTDLGRWSLRGRLDWREWGGEFVARLDDTGATYLLSTLAGETIKALRDGAGHVDEIAASVFSDSAPHSAATAALVCAFAEVGYRAQDILKVLLELQALGLVRADLA
jgi:hypothetical protein